MTTQEQIAVMQAYTEGKTIQYRSNIQKDWVDVVEPLWDWVLVEYRVKPEITLPTTWEEFCATHPIHEGEAYIDRMGITAYGGLGTGLTRVRRHALDKGYLPNKELADAMLALCQLIQLRDCYNDGWQPDWSDYTMKFMIYPYKNDIEWDYLSNENRILAFKTDKRRNEFYKNFKDLIETAKPLL